MTIAYRINEAQLSVPPGWRDQSMNVFRLPGANGSKDASIIVTRDHDTALDNAADYAKSLQESARKQFSGYKLLAEGEATIDGEPAYIVDYTWRSNGTALLRQRQAFVRHTTMLIVTLTALASEFERHEPAWLEVLGTLKLRRDEPAEPAPHAPAANDEPVALTPAAPQASPGHLYALSLRHRTLHVVPLGIDLNSAFNAVDVEDGLWAFYAADGMPLRWRITEPNRRGIFWSDAGKFELTPDDRASAAPLGRILDEIRVVKGEAPLQTLAAVRESLRRLGGSTA